jgi:hypothetical protein
MRKKILLLALAPVLAPALAHAQSAKACGYTGVRSMAKLEYCLDSLKKKIAGYDSAIARVNIWEAQGRPTMADFYAKLPHKPFEGATVDQAIAAAIAVIPAAPSPAPAPGGNVMLGNTLMGGLRLEGDLVFRGNTEHAVTQGGITDEYRGRLSANGWDGGFRLLQNWNYEGTTHLPFSVAGPDSRGAWSYNWWPQGDGGGGGDIGPIDTVTAPYYSGQTLVIDGGSQRPYAYGTETSLSSRRYALIASQRKGWPLYFAVSPTRPNGYPENFAVLKLNSDGSPNPVEIVIDGSLRRIRSCTDASGQKLLCY